MCESHQIYSCVTQQLHAQHSSTLILPCSGRNACQESRDDKADKSDEQGLRACENGREDTILASGLFASTLDRQTKEASWFHCFPILERTHHDLIRALCGCYWRVLFSIVNSQFWHFFHRSGVARLNECVATGCKSSCKFLEPLELGFIVEQMMTLAVNRAKYLIAGGDALILEWATWIFCSEVATPEAPMRRLVIMACVKYGLETG
jgi:hypothetical protein